MRMTQFSQWIAMILPLVVIAIFTGSLQTGDAAAESTLPAVAAPAAVPLTVDSVGDAAEENENYPE